MADQEKHEKMMNKIKKERENFSMFKLEDRNQEWINRARKDYMGKYDGGKNIENMQ